MQILPARGRPAKAMRLEVRRELTGDDILRLAQGDAPRTAPPVIQTLTAVHHATARLLASGRSHKEVAILVGRTEQRVGDLSRDPAFRQLVEMYASQITDIEISELEHEQMQLRTMAQLADAEIIRRLESPESIAAMPINELRQISAHGLDRTIAPPKTAVPATQPPLSVTFNMGQRDIKPSDDDEDHQDDRPQIDHAPGGR